MRGRYVIAAAAAAIVVWATVAFAIAFAATGEDKKADVAVPRVLGLRGNDAALELEAVGLRFFADEHLLPFQSSSTSLTMTTTQSLSGVVVAQSPSAGVSVRPGSTVELSVAHKSSS
jgi:beta-lactam-binding protein with PASTA domain